MAKLKNRNAGVILFFIISILILFLFEPPLKSTMDKEFLQVYLYVFIGSLVVYLIYENQKNWFRLDILFLFGFAIVHFQWPMMLSISDIEPIRFEKLQSNYVYINYGTWLSTIGILFWFLGVVLLKKQKYKKVEYAIEYKYILWLTGGFFALFLLTAGSNFFTGSVYKGEGGSASGEGISGYIQLFFTISLTILTVLILLDAKKTHQKSTMGFVLNLNRIFLLISIMYIFIFLAAGDRGGPMQFMMVLLILIGSVIRPIKFKEFSLIIIMGAIVLTIVGAGRANTSDENILLAGANSIELTSKYDFSINLANSARTLYIALAHVPEEHEPFLGQLWIGSLLGIVPFAQKTYLNISEMKPYEISSPQYITYLRYGENASSGEGTTIIADIYLNFGEGGVIVIMFLLGLFFKKLQNELNLQKNLYWIIIAISLGGVAFYMGRGMLLSSYRTMIWSLILVFIFVKFEKRIIK